MTRDVSEGHDDDKRTTHHPSHEVVSGVLHAWYRHARRMGWKGVDDTSTNITSTDTKVTKCPWIDDDDEWESIGMMESKRRGRMTQHHPSQRGGSY